MKNALTQNALDERIAWPLDRKIKESQNRILQWVEAWGGGASVSYSGGIDSTVLLDLVRTHPGVDGKKIPACFADTGTEYPEIRKFVKETPSVAGFDQRRNFTRL